MSSTSLGFRSGPLHPRPVVQSAPEIMRASFSTEEVNELDTTGQTGCTHKSFIRTAVMLLYLTVTILDSIRGVIHTFLYEIGINDISGLATGDALCDNRLSSLMIAYGGANLESFLVRSYILYEYARYDRGCDYMCVSSIAAALWFPATWVTSYTGGIDVGDADLPGRYAMLTRSVISFIIFLLIFYGNLIS